MIKYGLTQQDIHEYRSAFKTACECTAGIPEAKADWFGYYMAQLAQTYHTRKVMYDNPVRNQCVRPDCPVLCAGLSQGS